MKLSEVYKNCLGDRAEKNVPFGSGTQGVPKKGKKQRKNKKIPSAKTIKGGPGRHQFPEGEETI